jgi:hypothetical protein
MYLKIKKNGLFAYEWDSEIQKNVGKRVKKDRVLSKLRENCFIDKDVTLIDIFRMVASYKLLKYFIQSYSWCQAIDEFHEQAEEPIRNDENDDEKLDYLEIYHIVDSYDSKNKIQIDKSTAFHAKGKVKESVLGKLTDGNYSISCAPMYELADLPVRLRKKIEIYEPWQKKKFPKILFEGESYFTLLEILDAIYWEISFHGGPQEKDKFRDSLKSFKENIDLGIEKIYSFDELKEKLGLPSEPEDQENKMKIFLTGEMAEILGVDPEDLAPVDPDLREELPEK